VNITVENLAPCKKLLRVELDAKAVDEAFDAVTKDFQKQAALPRLPARQGAAQPRAQEIRGGHQGRSQTQAHRRPLPQGARGKKLHVIGYPDIEEIQFRRGRRRELLLEPMAVGAQAIAFKVGAVHGRRMASLARLGFCPFGGAEAANPCGGCSSL
jgi:hypothetical protein